MIHFGKFLQQRVLIFVGFDEFVVELINEARVLLEGGSAVHR